MLLSSRAGFSTGSLVVDFNITLRDLIFLGIIVDVFKPRQPPGGLFA